MSLSKAGVRLFVDTYLEQFGNHDRFEFESSSITGKLNIERQSAKHRIPHPKQRRFAPEQRRRPVEVGAAHRHLGGREDDS